MLDLTGVDGVIRGEPESTVGDLAAGCDWLATPGLTFRRDGQVVSTAERPPLDMTTLPLPALHLLDLRHYSYEILGPRFLVLEGSRGCPYPCTFCSRVIQGKPLRQKTVEQLGREVETAVRKFGVRNIYFIDLEFTALPESGPRPLRVSSRPQDPRALVLPDADRQDRRAALAADEAGRLPLDSFRRRVGQPADRRDDEEAGDDRPPDRRRETRPAGWLGSALLLSVGLSRRDGRGDAEHDRAWPGDSVPRMLRFIASRPIRARRSTTSSRPAARSFFPHTPAARKIAARWIV